MLLFALITVILLLWSLMLSARVLYIGNIVKELKSKLGTLVPLDPFTTALASAEQVLAAGDVPI